MEKADETTGATGLVNKYCAVRIDEENAIIDQGKKIYCTFDPNRQPGPWISSISCSSQ
jgi:hypothetical protein